MAGISIEEHAVQRPSRTVQRPSRNSMAAADEFERLLNARVGENEIQAFIESVPIILSEQLPHCHHVIPKPKLGSEYVPDFLLPEMSSAGTDWYLVELEPVDDPLVTKQGQYAQRVREAIQQIKDWRSWLSHNLDYASRSKLQRGLGLQNISPRPVGWVVVGRKSAATDRFNQLRRQTWENDLINVMTYDRLLAHFRKRAEHWDSWDRRIASLLFNGS